MPSTQLEAVETRETQTAETAAAPSLTGLLPGLLLTGGIAAAAFALHAIPGISALSPMILAILIGIAAHNLVGTPAWAKPGVAFSLRRVLRLGVILLGFQLTAAQVVAVGGRGLLVIVLTLLATFAFTLWLGRRLKVEEKLTQLIAAGTSICGASAVIATDTVTEAPDEDVAYAVACVTVFGSIAMVTYPLLPGLLHLSPHEFGLWAGSSIHEVAQVVAAAYQDGQQSGDFGTIAKLSRVMLLAPMVISLGIVASRHRSNGTGGKGKRLPLPWFVLGFVAVIAINSAVPIPTEAKSVLVPATTVLLSMALAAMGLETDIAKLRAKGLRPLLVGAGAFLFIASFSLLLVKLMM
ncbi:YeiH family protein [Methyloligella sp. 2.7D]|uniref:YeiH family protein n=1 Tax=unclassified Methyloligella TaxID=2625955 RepID=UPI00157D2411|nr:YeiH family protein [Methyloligella sp. GL2]QKP76218.1 YeiH family putative sulfate export transporter [Methyloligella sp. GL2]